VTETPIDNTSRTWFDAGYEAFVRTFPSVASKIPYRPFYVCPLCLRAGSEGALSQRWLTREHVPPRSMGGRKIVLTCAPCNSVAGHAMDADMRREASLFDFFSGTVTPRMRGVLLTTSSRIPVQLEVTKEGIVMFAVPKAAHPMQSEGMKADFNRATVPGDNWKDLKFKVEFERFSQPRAETSWLRSGYLALFATLGYRYIGGAELEVVRQRIKNPGSIDPLPFRMVLPRPVDVLRLMRINDPEPFRSYAVIYGRNIVFLPRYGDGELYDRLAAQPSGEVTLTGDSYDWPTQPLFLHDQVNASPASRMIWFMPTFISHSISIYEMRCLITLRYSISRVPSGA
jgi:hypothetical protein